MEVTSQSADGFVVLATIAATRYLNGDGAECLGLPAFGVATRDGHGGLAARLTEMGIEGHNPSP